MTSASRRSLTSGASGDLVRELRTFSREMDRYVNRTSHLHTMHRTDLNAIGLVMDRGGTSPKDISEALDLSPSATSAMLDRLEGAGHVIRTRADTDRRGVRVEVTDSALEVGRSMFSLLAAHMRDALEDWDDTDLARLTVLLEHINASVQAASREAAES